MMPVHRMHRPRKEHRCGTRAVHEGAVACMRPAALLCLTCAEAALHVI